jgi:hypothetical protein
MIIMIIMIIMLLLLYPCSKRYERDLSITIKELKHSVSQKAHSLTHSRTDAATPARPSLAWLAPCLTTN